MQNEENHFIIIEKLPASVSFEEKKKNILGHSLKNNGIKIPFKFVISTFIKCKTKFTRQERVKDQHVHTVNLSPRTENELENRSSFCILGAREILIYFLLGHTATLLIRKSVCSVKR